MRFDYIIGNPPYQEEIVNDNATYSPPVYDKFLEAAYSVSDCVEMVHPARFLFKAGRTPKAWNEKMLNDPHLTVKLYEADASKLFNNTEIKGGIAITYRDLGKDFGTISTFTQYPELNSILKKLPDNESSITDIIYLQNRFDLDAFYSDYPEYKTVIGSGGKDSRFEKNIFEKVSLFGEQAGNLSAKTTGIYNNKRVKRYIPQKYVDKNHVALNKYKIIVPVANGNGKFGSTLGGLEILGPDECYTRSFIGIGAFSTKEEANAALSYLKTKFARTMLSILKVTQMNNKDVWQYVPLQVFSAQSDIDWSTSVSQIDQQLYKKYGLTQEEISFIETHVKEME